MAECWERSFQQRVGYGIIYSPRIASGVPSGIPEVFAFICIVMSAHRTWLDYRVIKNLGCCSTPASSQPLFYTQHMPPPPLPPQLPKHRTNIYLRGTVCSDFATTVPLYPPGGAPWIHVYPALTLPGIWPSFPS